MPAHGSRGIWPRDVLKKVSRGLSRVDYKMCLFVVNNGLSPEDAERLKEMCKKSDGTISATKMQNVIAEIMSAVGEQAKN